MRIVSLNGWGGAMFDALADWLSNLDVDVLCLQEVTRTPGLGGWTRFEDVERSLPQRANLFADVQGLLPQHQGFFVCSDAGPVSDAEGDQHQQDFGIAVFVHERIPVVGQTASFVHGEFVDHRDWAVADRPRVVQAVRVIDRAEKKIVNVTHLHGLRDPAGKGDTVSRKTQAKRLARVVERDREPGDFVVVCGDLNLLPDSETFSILGEIGLVDLVGTIGTRTSRYTKPVRHANYLLVSDREAVKRFEILERPEVSDHCALVLDC